MSKEVPTVARNTSLEEYVHEVLRTGRRSHIVMGADRPVGFVTLHAAREVPKDEWGNTSIQAVMKPIDQIHWATPQDPALGVLERMIKEDINQMPVIADGRIVGIVAREAILSLLQTRLRIGHAGQ
jgi:CBS domain-containing protein